ncbi:putative 2-dehydropantoate 2-reductase [Leptolyngbya ohadii]|uniref:putative 2-dehydropantoate 2-reductase n=1 Tax=Leptolyngbya ohadii TaxID=1962290 RepID=UPI000B59CBDF|nr:putative 2-dehydropantoate 2-reductase [Leptolyngbya ohadii]
MTYPTLPHRRTYAVIGTGALGGFYGARLQQAGCEVHFLLRSDYEVVRQKGLVVKSIDGDFTLPQVNAYRDVAEMPACDVVIVALKTTQNDLLPELLPSIVKPGGVVLVLQNGLGIEPEVAEIVGSHRVMGGMCFLCSNKIAPGVIHHLDYKQITMGDYADGYAPCGITDRQKQIAQDFEQAGIPIVQSEDLLLARWKKLMWNIPFNGLSVVLDATTDRMMADPHARQLATDLMQEVLRGANACLQQPLPASIKPSGSDRAIFADFVQTMLDYTEKMKPYRTSMKLDYDDRRPLEVEAIFGNPLRMAQNTGIHLPLVQMLYQQLKFLDSQNR